MFLIRCQTIVFMNIFLATKNAQQASAGAVEPKKKAIWGRKGVRVRHTMQNGIGLDVILATVFNESSERQLHALSQKRRNKARRILKSMPKCSKTRPKFFCRSHLLVRKACNKYATYVSSYGRNIVFLEKGRAYSWHYSSYLASQVLVNFGR